LDSRVLMLPETARLPNDGGGVARDALEQLREAVTPELARRDVRRCRHDDEARLEDGRALEHRLELCLEGVRRLQFADVRPGDGGEPALRGDSLAPAAPRSRARR